MRKIDFEIQYHAGNSDICRLKGLDISQLPECEGGSFTLPRAQAEYLAGLRAENERLAEENARLTRNNEMWRSQARNQASQIEALRDQVAALSEAQP